MDRFIFEGLGIDFLIEGKYTIFLFAIIVGAIVFFLYQAITKKNISLPFLKSNPKSSFIQNGSYVKVLQKTSSKLEELEKMVEANRKELKELSKEQAVFRAKIETDLDWLKKSFERIIRKLDRRRK